MVRNIARHIMAEPDPAKRLAQLHRLRQGTFLTMTADADRAMAEVHKVEASGAAIDAATMVVPLLNDSRDFYEFWDGKDAWTGRELLWWERALAGVGVIAGSGKAFREIIKRAGDVPNVTATLRKGKISKKQQKTLDQLLDSDGKVPDKIKNYDPYFEARQAAADAVRNEAKEKADEFVAALKSKDKDRIRNAVVEVKGDRQAITVLNKQSNFIKKKFNDALQEEYDDVFDLYRKKMADHLNKKLVARRNSKRIKAGDKGVSRTAGDMSFTPNQQHGRRKKVRARDAELGVEVIQPHHVKIFTASNPTNRVKIGRDLDYTTRVLGQDIPSKEARKLYNEAMFETLKKKKALPRGVKNPTELGEKLDQTAVHWLDDEAYNKKGLSVVLNPSGLDDYGRPYTEKRKYLIYDVRQVGATMEFKGVENFAKSDKFRRLGNLRKAEEHMMEGMYQIRKQFDNQILGRVKAAVSRDLFDLKSINVSPDLRRAIDRAKAVGDKKLAEELLLRAAIPDDLRRAIDVFRKVEDGWSPAEAQAVLKKVFKKTPDDVARQMKEALIEWEMRIMNPPKKAG